MNRLIIGLILILAQGSLVCAEDQYFTTLSNALPRTIALGGATTAVTGGPLSLGLNPATFRMYSLPGSARILVLLNPIGIYSTVNAADNVEGAFESATLAIRMLVRFVGVSYEFFDLGLRLSDEIPTTEDQRFFPEKDIYQFHSNTLLLRFKLHPYVSIGLQTMGYTHGNKIDKFGYCYGVLLRPGSKVDVGVSYLDLPARYQNVLHPLLRIGDETVNIGMAIHPAPSTNVSIDLRNITHEGSQAFLEPHFGVEQVVIPHLVLRGGGAVFSDSNRKIISGGVGILDWNRFVRYPRRLVGANYVLQYGVALEYALRLQSVWHTLTICIRL
jgi:hypothetical protein